MIVFFIYYKIQENPFQFVTERGFVFYRVSKRLLKTNRRSPT